MADDLPVDGQIGKPDKKDWCRPVLQKLPIAATASNKFRGADEGAQKSSSGDASPIPIS
jgi:hypothetical protein